MYPQLRFVFLLPFLKTPPVSAAKNEHPYGNYCKKYKDIGPLPVCFPKISNLVYGNYSNYKI